MPVPEVQTVSEEFDLMRASLVSRDLLEHENLVHTAYMIHYAEAPSLTPEERKDGLMRTIAELELVYRENKKHINPVLREFTERNLKCAREDVSAGDYWAAISDIDYLEMFPLKMYIPKSPNLTGGLEVHLLLAMKTARGMGARIKRESDNLTTFTI